MPAEETTAKEGETAAAETTPELTAGILTKSNDLVDKVPAKAVAPPPQSSPVVSVVC